MLNFGASKPRVKGGAGPRAPPGSAPELKVTGKLSSRMRMGGNLDAPPHPHPTDSTAPWFYSL